MLTRNRRDAWTALFLWTTLATSVTGFLFPFYRFLPSHGVGIVSLIVLAVAIPARYLRSLEGGWRRAYVIGAVTSLYLNVFVLIAQIFQKVPALTALAPTQSEPAFVWTQAIALMLFVGLGATASMRFREDRPIARSFPAAASLRN
jgi:hypothetical protein